jgi:hypothetical protein
VRTRADRPGNLPDRDGFARALETLLGAAKFVVHQGHLEAEGGRLSMNPVAAANHGRELMFARLRSNHLPKFLNIADQNVRRLHHLDRERGIDDVAAGEAEVKPATRLAVDVFCDVGGERDNVVVQRALEFLAAVEAEGGFRLHLLKVGFRNDALLDKRFGGKQLDLQPNLQLALLGPDVPHLGAGITLNHVRKIGRRDRKGKSRIRQSYLAIQNQR